MSFHLQKKKQYKEEAKEHSTYTGRNSYKHACHCEPVERCHDKAGVCGLWGIFQPKVLLGSLTRQAMAMLLHHVPKWENYHAGPHPLEFQLENCDNFQYRLGKGGQLIYTPTEREKRLQNHMC